jgi:DNA-binding transcriptional ArsR family regulator
MARPCSICTHSSRDAIDEALIAGEAYRKISERFGVSPAALSRHLRRHLVALLAGRREVEADNLLEQVADLQRQAQAIKDKAEAAGDLKTALQGIRELVRIIELLAKLRGELDTRPVVNVLLSSEWLQVRAVLLRALAPFPEARQAAAAALLEVGDEHGN